MRLKKVLYKQRENFLIEIFFICNPANIKLVRSVRSKFRFLCPRPTQSESLGLGCKLFQIVLLSLKFGNY